MKPKSAAENSQSLKNLKRIKKMSQKIIITFIVLFAVSFTFLFLNDMQQNNSSDVLIGNLFFPSLRQNAFTINNYNVCVYGQEFCHYALQQATLQDLISFFKRK